MDWDKFAELVVKLGDNGVQLMIWYLVLDALKVFATLGVVVFLIFGVVKRVAAAVATTAVKHIEVVERDANAKKVS